VKYIGVFYGGKSVEHDISIITALQAMSAAPKGFFMLPIYITPEGKMVTGDNLKQATTYLNFAKNVKGLKEVVVPIGSGEICLCKRNKMKTRIKLDCALLCNHGHGGEDGSLQGLLELAEIPYTSCSVSSSAMCMDKDFTKVFLQTNGINTPAYLHISIDSYKDEMEKFIKDVEDFIGYPCIVKPTRLGSSVGIGICANEAELESKIEEAFKFDNKLVVEEYLSGVREFCCAVVKNSGKLVASKVCEVVKSEIYTFEEKYINHKKGEQKVISKALEKAIKDMAVASYKALECDGVVRVDFLYDEESKKLFVNEINSIPGSLAFNLFETSFADLLMTLFNEAKARGDSKKTIVYKFNSKAIEKYIEMSSGFKVK